MDDPTSRALALMGSMMARIEQVLSGHLPQGQSVKFDVTDVLRGQGGDAE